MQNSLEHSHLRRQAIVIVSQLPGNTAEALTVLDYARHLVTEFLEEPAAGTAIQVRQNSPAGSH
jgi:glutamine synthetase